ncbi:hypothetical protein QQS21_007187 [Conoideocrella luteorostrata]|uniref:SMP-30/Gluconolactonase/LRE-like region domain-containing protein n=1 Tax=Conoideocrella luteorostrata TaxID=1105319 RepID=A0AAJ0CP44_9HYPO|nr:hypothetical protein QQS21_007187 [Conoideocrella luteorostrata]
MFYFFLFNLVSFTCAVTIRQLYRFPNDTFIENIAVRSNGHLLISTFDNAKLYSVEPCLGAAKVSVVAQVPNATALLGIAEIAPDVFAISAGNFIKEERAFEKGSGRIAIVRLNRCAAENPTVETVAWIPETRMLNGMVALPENRHIILSADSINGRLFRINTANGVIDVVFQDKTLLPGSDGVIPVGVNGLRIYKKYLYFTNSGQQFFARVKIDEDGAIVGAVEELLRLPINSQDILDDFSLSLNGTAFIAVHPNRWVIEAAPGKAFKVIADSNNDTFMDGPTSLALSEDEQIAYVVTGGMKEGNFGKGGQVFEVYLHK